MSRSQPGGERRAHPDFGVAPPGFGAKPGVSSRVRSAFWILLVTAVAVGLVLAFGTIHYELNQAPHRLWKILLGIFLAGMFVVVPSLALWALPLAFAFTEWMPRSPVPMLNALNVMTYVLIFSWAGRSAILRRTFIEWTPVNLAIGLFVGWATLSCIYGTLAGGYSLFKSLQNYWLRIVGLVLFFPLFATIETWQQVRRLAVWFCVASAAGLVSVAQEYAGYGGDHRVAGAIGDINVAGAFFAISALFAMGLVRLPRIGLMQRLVLLGSAASSTIAMLLTGSRGALVALFAGAVPQAFRAGVVGVLGMALLVGGIMIGAPGVLKERVQQTVESVGGAEGGSEYSAVDETSGGRLAIWGAVLRIVAGHPLFGVGMGQLPRNLESEMGRYKAAHNLYLEILGEMGVPGLLILLYLIWKVLRAAVELSRCGGYAGALGMSYLFATIGLFVANMFGQRLLHFSMDGSWAFMTALVMRARALTLTDRAAGA